MTRKNVVMFDIETTGAQNLFSQTPQEQFRLGQWAVGRDGEIKTTPTYDNFMEVIEGADLLVGHNIIGYDLTSLYGTDSTRPLELALENRVLDTFVWYPQRNRVPVSYQNRAGRRATTYQQGKQKPELVWKYLALDNLTHQHGLPGKEGDLVALAKKYNPPKTLKKNLDFGLIPVDDPEYLAYGVQDIVALQGLAAFLMDQGPITEYEWREMLVNSINAQISRNGWRVNQEMAQARVDELATERDEIMDWLVKAHDFPTEGAQPWKSAKGKQAILDALAIYGITPKHPDWVKTPTGAPSFGGKVIAEITEGTEAERLGRSLATLMGQRSLAELALESTWPDGRVHPSITTLQRSGRTSVSKPGLTVWTARGPGAVEKEYFIASEGCKLVEMDLSNADQRIVAALSGDPNYAKRFIGDADGHEISGRLMFGDEVYDSDPEGFRTIAKALSHAFAYGAGKRTLAATAKLPESDDPEMQPEYLAQKFIDAMNDAYPWNKAWRNRAYEEGQSGWVTNDWGRRMPVDVDRAFTQAPALYGQSGTREILFDGLIAIARADVSVLRWLVATVHDAAIWDIPTADLEWAPGWIIEKMTRRFKPKAGIGQEIEFPMSMGKPADNWRAAGH